MAGALSMNSPAKYESRPKCLLITDNFPPKGGGVSRYYAGLASGYGPAMKVCSPESGNSNDGHGHLSLPNATSRRGQLNQAFAAARIFRQSADRILLLGHPHLGLLPTLMPRSHPIGLIIHGGEWQEFKRLKRLLYAVEARCDFIIANSGATAADWLDSRLAQKIVILRPGLDSDWIASGAVTTDKQSISSRNESFRLLTVARLVPRKGISETARVVADLRRDGQDVELRVVGDGPMLSELRADFKSEPAIQFLGPLSDEELQKSYEWADAFVLCPHTISGGEGYEGFGIVYLEAAAYGLPIVATVSGGVGEALDPAGSLTAQPKDWDEVRERLRCLIQMPRARLAAMRDANLRWASLNSWSRRSDELANSLKERVSSARQ